MRVSNKGMTTRVIDISGRPCPDREGSGIDGAYTRAELVRTLVEEAGMHEEHLASLPMKRLCNLLQQARRGLPVHVPEADRPFIAVAGRPCGAISSREYPDSYSKDEVVDILTLAYDLRRSKVQALPIPVLCGFLKLHERGEFVPPDDLRRPSHIMVRGRPCGPDHTLEGAYSNDELRTLAYMDLGIPTKAYDRYTDADKRRLCNRLLEMQSARRVSSRRRQREGTPTPSPSLPDTSSAIERELLRRSVRSAKRRRLATEKKIRRGALAGSSSSSSADDMYSSSSLGEEAEWLSSSPSSMEQEVDDECITASRIPLKDHQKRLVRHLQTARGAIAAFGVGTGKTLTAVTASQCFLRSNPRREVIVVTPTSLQANFRKELQAYGAAPPFPGYKFFTIDGFVMAVREGRVNCADNMLIIDEAHNLRTMIEKGTRGQRQAASVAVQCAKRAARVLLLTATPVVDRPSDLNNLIAMARGEDPMTKDELKAVLENPEELGCLFFFHEKQEEGAPDSPEFPRKVEVDVPIRMTPAFQAMYEEVESAPKSPDQRRAAYDKFGRNTFLALFGKSDLKQFYNGVRTAANAIDFRDNPKIQWVMQQVEAHPADKFVIFTSFVDKGIELVAAALRRIGVSYLTVTGKMSADERGSAVSAYNSGRVRVLLISSAGGEGLDLKETKHLIIMEPAWNETAVEQIVGRGVRFRSHATLPGPEREVKVYRLYLLKAHEADEWDLVRTMDYETFKDWSAEHAKVPSIDLFVAKLSADKETRYKEVLGRFRAASAALCPQ